MKLRCLTVSLWCGLLASLVGAWWARPDLRGHGLYAHHRYPAEQVEAVALVTANDGAGLDDPFPAQWTGYLYQPRSEQVTFRVPPDVGATLSIDGQLVFDKRATERPTVEAAGIYLTTGSHPVKLEFTPPEDWSRYFQAGLEWETIFGWRLVPAVYLYPQEPDPRAAQRVIHLAQWSAGLSWLAAAFGLGLIGLGLWSQRHLFRWRIVLGLASLVGLALGLRLLFLHDITRSPASDILPIGSDHRSYQSFALGALRGTWPTEAFFFKPGMSLALTGLYMLVGPSIRVAQVLQMILGALTTVAIFDFARRAFDSATGWIAALLWAIFPFPIFYEAFVLTHGLEAIAGAILLWLWLRMLETPHWHRVALCGLWLGATIVLRPTFLALAPCAALSLAWRGRAHWPTAIKDVVVLVLTVTLPIAPITWHNYRASGRFQLISGEGPLTLYMGNNRDSSGYGEPSAAMAAVDILVPQGKADYTQQTLEDIRANPGRWAQLMVRKTAFFLSDHEVPNNVDFHRDGVAVSPGLAVLPLRFGGMLALAITGLILALRRPRPWNGGLIILLIYLTTHSLIVVAYVVLSRLRAPLYPGLIVLAGWAVTTIVTRLRQRQWKLAAWSLALLAVNRLAVANMLRIADNVMSLPVIAAPPPGTHILNAPLGESLTLVGYDPLPVAKPGEPTFVTLYWQRRGPLELDLIGTLQVIVGSDLEQKIAQDDHPIGAGTFPRYLTSQWQAGQIIRDQYLLKIPIDAPTPTGLNILVAAYVKETGQRVGEVTFGPLPLTRAEELSVPSGTLPVGAKIGTATLAAYRAVFDRAGMLHLTLYWQSGGPLSEDGVVFVHIFDHAGKFVMGEDSRPRNGTYSTLAWQPREGVVDEHRLPWPADAPPGEYRMAVGMYFATTLARLPIVDANGAPVTDNVLTLGTIQR